MSCRRHPGRSLPLFSIVTFCAAAIWEQVQEYRSPGLDSFQVSSGFRSITVEVWGVGGGGGPKQRVNLDGTGGVSGWQLQRGDVQAAL